MMTLRETRDIDARHPIERRVSDLQLALVLGHGTPQYFAGTNALYQVLEATKNEVLPWE